MPQAVGTKTLANVATYVKAQFGDTAGVQIDDADIARWTNAAMLEIVTKSPLTLEAKSTLTGAVGLFEYEYPPGIIQAYSVMYGERILVGVSFELWAEKTGPDFAATTGEPRYWTHWGNNFQIWPIPTVAETVTIFYTKVPNAVSSLGDLLELPDHYFPRVTDYVMSKAQELDEDYTASQNSRQLFEDKLREMGNKSDSMDGRYHIIDDQD